MKRRSLPGALAPVVRGTAQAFTFESESVRVRSTPPSPSARGAPGQPELRAARRPHGELLGATTASPGRRRRRQPQLRQGRPLHHLPQGQPRAAAEDPRGRHVPGARELAEGLHGRRHPRDAKLSRREERRSSKPGCSTCGSASLPIGDQQARVRVGNQVVSWGESLFALGGINSTNAMDIMRLSQPGTQLKEVFLPAPIVSVASGLGTGLNVEAYVQSRWNPTTCPGSYWSVADILDKGRTTPPSGDRCPSSARRTTRRRRTAASAAWRCAGSPGHRLTSASMHELPRQDAQPGINGRPGTTQWTFVENRKLFGVSANFPVGDWAIGTELSYRPKDAVALTACADAVSGGSAQHHPDRAPRPPARVRRRQELPVAPDRDLSLTPENTAASSTSWARHRHVAGRGRRHPLPRAQPGQAVAAHRRGRRGAGGRAGACAGRRPPARRACTIAASATRTPWATTSTSAGPTTAR